MNKDKKKWVVLDSEYLMRRPWLTVRRDTVRLPTGVVNPEFYVLEYPDWVNVIAITRDGQFVMERQYRHGLGDTGYEICAGVMEEGETPLQAAQRELAEETGYGGGDWSLFMTISANTSVTNNLTYCFIAKDVEPIFDRRLDDTEDIDVELLSQDDVYQLLANDKLKQALMVAPLWRYFASLKDSD